MNKLRIQRGLDYRAGRAALALSYRLRGRSGFFVHPRPEWRADPTTSSLDLGCGDSLANPFAAGHTYGVDIVPVDDDRVKVADLTCDRIPFDDNSFQYVTAIDFLEHIPRLMYLDGQRRQPFIEIMNEIHRVLVPNGVFYAHTPAFPRREAYDDPTHVNVIGWGTSAYFTNPLYTDLAHSYGIRGRFGAISQYWDRQTLCHLNWMFAASK